MQVYDLTKAEEVGRLMHMLMEVTGGEAQIVISYQTVTEDGQEVNGAVSTVPPIKAIRMMAAAMMELGNSEEGDFKTQNMRVN